jgi:hypothetical protein
MPISPAFDCDPAGTRGGRRLRGASENLGPNGAGERVTLHGHEMEESS